MIYLITLFIISFYLYFTERFSESSVLKQLIIWLPAIIFFAFPLSFQYQVGTDYNTYNNYFYDNGHVLHKERGELLYYYIVEIVKFLNEPQLQFMIVGFIQSILFFYLLFLLKRNGFKSWLIFILFFLCTGIYNNSMNGLRQFIAVYIFLVCSILLYEKRLVKFNYGFISAVLFHFSSLFSFLLLIIIKLMNGKIFSRIILFYIFVISFFVYVFNYSNFIYYVLDVLELRYITYFDSEFSEGKNLLSVALKFYYLPLVFVFWFYYLREKCNSKNTLFDFFILVFSITYFMFLQGLSFGLFMRIWQYFNFFLVFPLYYVFVKSSRITFILFFLYILVFYLLKVIVFPVAEYDYFFYRGWF